MSKRGRIEEALPILGIPERTVRDMAACGELPGAAKIAGRWTFNMDKRLILRTPHDHRAEYGEPR